MMEVAGNPKYLRFAVAENPNRDQAGKYGVIIVDEKNGVSPVGRQDFGSHQEAERAFVRALGELIDGNVKATWG